MQQFIGRVTEKKYITDNVFLMSLTAPEDFDFKAGQFVTFMVNNGETTKPRSYSILNIPSIKGKLDFCIKILPDGFASKVFEKTEVGDEFTVKGPFGMFVFEDTDYEHIFLGTGTGIAPLLSMIKTNLNKKTTLIMGYYKQKDIILDEELKQLQMENPNFTYKVTLDGEDWDGLKGRAQEHLPEDISNKKFYICGIKEMITDTRDKLLSLGVPKEKIDFERFS